MEGKITYHQQVSFCGKSRCRRCREGIGHGPYWYAYQTVNGRTVRTYVGKNPPAEMLSPQVEDSGSSPSEFASTLLRLHVLGQFRLEQRSPQSTASNPVWEPVTDTALQHQRVRSLLSCLASSPGRKLAREQAIDKLWPELDSDTGSHRLDRAVHSLRQLFEPGRSRPATSKLLLTEHSTLALADQSLFWIDADAFETFITRARSSDDPGQMEQLLEEAAQLYNGDFLAEETQFAWVHNRRETLRRNWISVLLELADLRIAREATPGAIEILDRLLTADPTNEAAVQRLIALLAQTGRRGEAIQAYNRFARVLKEDYKITPLPETRELYEAVRSGGKVEAPHKRQDSKPGITSTSSELMAVRPAHMHIGRTHQSPLVGRDEEIARLHQVLQITEQTRRVRLTGQKKTSLPSPLSLEAQRNAQCIMLMGDVGIGKTRLAEEAAREAKRRNWAVAWCRAYVQESNVPYRLWTETLRKAMTQGLWQRQEVTRRPLIYQPLRSLLPELQDLLPASLQVMPPPPEQEQLRLWESTRALLSTICENTTLLIVLDDLQWADTSSCDLLTYLVRQMRGQPVMFLCTCRDTEIPKGHHLHPLLTDLQREQAIGLLPIEPLSKEQIRALISHLPETMAETISTRASGNPFFAEELARGVVAGDLVAAFDPSKPRDLPETITAVLDLRLARISQQCQRLLERGAVLGDAFQFDTICAMASGGVPADEDMILDLLEEAMQAGMLTEEGNGVNIIYNFWHPLLLTYLYDHISAARRASLHRRAALVMQEYYTGREAEGAAEIVHHLVNGGSASTLIARFAELAADRAYSLSAYPFAEKHYRLTLEHLGNLSINASPVEKQHHAYILERLGECAIIVGKYAEARQFYEQTLDLRPDPLTLSTPEEQRYEAQWQALLWCEMSRAWRYLGESVKARECLEKGEKVLNDASVVAGPAWARVLYQQGHTYWLEGNLTEALSMAKDALQRFETLPDQYHQSAHTSFLLTQAQRILNGDHLSLGRVYTLLAGIEATLGRTMDALAYLNKALTVFEQDNIKSEIANVCCNLADLYLRQSEHELARPLLIRSRELAEEVGHAPIMSVALVNLGVLAARLGDLLEAETWYRQALIMAEQVNDLFYISLFHSYVAMALIDQGKLDDAEPLLIRSLKISRSRRIAPCIGFALVALGQLRLVRVMVKDLQDKLSNGTHQKHSGKASKHLLLKARATLNRALAFDGLEADTVLHGKLLLARIALLLQETENAQERTAKALEEAYTSDLVWLQARAQCLLAQTLIPLGERDSAETYFQQALATFAKTGMRLDRARTLQAYGSALLEDAASSARQQAVQYLQEARQLFQECHAALDLQEVERLLTLAETSTRQRIPVRTRVRKARESATRNNL